MIKLNRKRIYAGFNNLLKHGMERSAAWRMAVSAGRDAYRMGYTNDSPDGSL